MIYSVTIVMNMVIQRHVLRMFVVLGIHLLIVMIMEYAMVINALWRIVVVVVIIQVEVIFVLICAVTDLLWKMQPVQILLRALIVSRVVIHTAAIYLAIVYGIQTVSTRQYVENHARLVIKRTPAITRMGARGTRKNAERFTSGKRWEDGY